MQVFKKIWFFIIMIAIMAAMTDSVQELVTANDNFIQDRNKSIYRILREPENSIDVVVVGDSLSYTSVSPMELWKEYGITSYICGQSGQTTQESFHMLKEVFKKQSPRVIVMEAHALFKEQSGSKGIKEILGEAANYYFPLIRNHNIWKCILTGKRYQEESYKGFSFRCDVKPYTKGAYMKKSAKMKEIPSNSLIYMKKIQKLCRKNGAKLLLYSAPSPVNYSYAKHNSIQKYAKEHSVEYLDMNLELDKIGIDWKTDSLDNGDHLNLRGAQKTTAYLGQYLKKYQNLVDHREDLTYHSWNNLYAKYRKEADQNLAVMR